MMDYFYICIFVIDLDYIFIFEFVFRIYSIIAHIYVYII